MIKLSKGQVAVLVLAATPMAVVGVVGAVATYVNMDNVLHRGASALGLVAAGEGATLICALIALAVTLMGQHTPATVRAGMWLVPLAASGVGIALAPTGAEAVVMAFTPLAMTAAGEGVAFVARRVVAYRTGVDIEQQRRSGLLLWHANRAANGGAVGQKLSKAAVWRLTRRFAETDSQLSVQLGEIQRYRIGQGADDNLTAVLTRETKPKSVTPAKAPELSPVIPARHHGYIAPLLNPEALTEAPVVLAVEETGFEELAAELDEVEEAVAGDPTVKLLTTAQVAALKGVKPTTVRSWKHRGKLPYTMVDGVPMYRQLDVMDLD
jgi:hypothetical protein